MLICHCNVITEKEIEQTIVDCSTRTPGNSIVPAKVYHALQKRGRCCGCFPNVVETIIRVTEDYHARSEASGGGYRFTPGPRQGTARPIREQSTMKGEKQVIERLNEALFLELGAVNQYWVHFRLLEDWGYTKLAKKERAESIEEMHHADRIVARIIFLEGHPEPAVAWRRCASGRMCKEVLESDLAGEYDARTVVQEVARDLPRHWATT